SAGGPPAAGPGAPQNAAPGSGPGAPADAAPGDDGPKAPDAPAPGGAQPADDRADDATTLSEPGQGAARQEALRNVQHLIDGDFVGRDKFVFLLGGKKQAAARRLGAQLHEGVQQAFVDPEGWAEVRQRFDGDRRTVILRGGPGQGRKAMAVRLLMSASAEVMYDLDPRIDLNQLAEQIEQNHRSGGAAEQGTGFLLCQPSSVAALHGRTLRDLDDALTEAGARLVLTVGPDVRLGDEDLIEYLVELPPAPSYRRIVERHLEWRLADERTVQKLLTRQDLQDDLAELLAAVASCEEAANLAFVLSEEPPDAIDLARVRDRLARRSLDEFDTWFEDLRELDVRIFAIALAALDGLPYEDVARAAEKLRRRLEPPEQTRLVALEPGQPIGRDHFRRPRRLVLEQLRASAVDAEVQRPYGLVPSQIVQYKDRSYPREVLSRVWRGYQIHDHLLGWLSDLVKEPSEPVRMQVATTLGVLASFSFHHVLTAVLHRWADSDELAVRDAVAFALRVPAADERLRGSVNHVVNQWFGATGEPARQATAARVHGVGLASADPEASLTALDRLARDAAPKVRVAIGASFIDLLIADGPRFAPTILDTLLRWFDDPKRTETARLVFLIVAHDLQTDRFPGDAGAEPVTWPTLLGLADDSKDVRGLLIRIWSRVLHEGSYFELAEMVIDSWAGHAERDQELLETFARMTRAVGSTEPRVRAILRRCAARWRSDDTLFPLPNTAHAVETVLAG
ncbi:MAG: hypothetical protein ACRDTE_10055, partial [Pseudonocardiaceae bacterium]